MKLGIILFIQGGTKKLKSNAQDVIQGDPKNKI